MGLTSKIYYWRRRIEKKGIWKVFRNSVSQVQAQRRVLQVERTFMTADQSPEGML